MIHHQQSLYVCVAEHQLLEEFRVSYFRETGNDYVTGTLDHIMSLVLQLMY